MGPLRGSPNKEKTDRKRRKRALTTVFILSCEEVREDLLFFYLGIRNSGSSKEKPSFSRFLQEKDIFIEFDIL